ncbi:MAG: hypothetical protein AB7P04_06420 [Bacteriovoracia bacterium]
MEQSYLRNGKVKVIPEKNGKPESQSAGARAAGGPTKEAPAPAGVRVNGYQQVLDMLRAADPEFRQSLLRRMAVQDPELVKNLQLELQRR